MKILLAAINAKYIHSNLAVYSLKSYAKKYENIVEIGEYTINHSVEYILEQLYRRKPDVLCFSCYLWNIKYVKEIIEELGKLMPELPIWTGGPEVSYDAREFLEENPRVTGVMRGEGEGIFSNLCGYYKNGGNLADIRGITYQTEGTIFMNRDEEPMFMDDIPFCYHDMKDFEHRIVYYESSRGCPFRCSYCLSSIDKQLRFRSLELVKKELLFFIEKKVPLVKFVDRTFNCDFTRSMEVWEFLKENDNGVTNYHFEIAADLLREEEISLLSTMRAGLIQLEIGVQSTNEETIQEIHRIMDFGRVSQVVRQIKEGKNIHQHLDLIAGLPFEDIDSFRESFDAVYTLKPEQLQMGFLKVLKGSYMQENRGEYEVVCRSGPPYEVLKTRWLTYDEMLQLKEIEEVLEVYYNSGQYPTAIGLLELHYKSPFRMYQALAEFYREHQYFAVSHSRMRRYEILREFMKQEDEGHLPCYEEALLYDLYLRENLKTRPNWSVEKQTEKKITMAVKGRNAHVERFLYDFTKNRSYEAESYPKMEEVYTIFDYEKRSPLTGQAEAGRY